MTQKERFKKEFNRDLDDYMVFDLNLFCADMGIDLAVIPYYDVENKLGKEGYKLLLELVGNE